MSPAPKQDALRDLQAAVHCLQLARLRLDWSVQILNLYPQYGETLAILRNLTTSLLLLESKLQPGPATGPGG